MKIKLKHYVQFRVSFIYCRISFLEFVKRVVIQRVTRVRAWDRKKKKKKGEKTKNKRKTSCRVSRGG